jgi:hypothetical protein
VLISEIPSAVKRKMIKPFSVYWKEKTTANKELS